MTTSSRQVVRKRLDDDCLLDGELHPSIAERLARVRELPVSAVATLIAIERDDTGVWMVWEQIPGMTLREFLSSSRTRLEREQIARELKRAVASLHAHGIVHGAIHERNVIIDLTGKLHLTHISPLLYEDLADDRIAVDELVNQLVPQQMQDRGGAIVDENLRRSEYLKAAAAILVGILILVAILWYIHT